MEGKRAAKEEPKVDNLLLVDYTEGSELMQCLRLAIESISRLIVLRKVEKSE